MVHAGACQRTAVPLHEHQFADSVTIDIHIVGAFIAGVLDRQVLRPGPGAGILQPMCLLAGKSDDDQIDRSIAIEVVVKAEERFAVALPGELRRRRASAASLQSGPA